jgi:hypothetical protein
MRDDLIRKALNTRESRAELESFIYAEHRHIWALDYDLAANRSMSLAAKVAFQRQRLVQRTIEQTVEEKNLWTRVNDWKNKVLSVAGIKL